MEDYCIDGVNINCKEAEKFHKELMKMKRKDEMIKYQLDNDFIINFLVRVVMFFINICHTKHRISVTKLFGRSKHW